LLKQRAGWRKYMKYRLDNQGFIKGILGVALVGLLVFIIISFAMPYYRQNILTSYSGSILNADNITIQKVRTRVMASARELKVPLKEENLAVQSSDGRISIQASWTEIVDFWGFYQKTLYFNIKAEQ
jgi:hypothetical protein